MTSQSTTNKGDYYLMEQASAPLDINVTLAERAHTHGNFEDTAAIIQQLKYTAQQGARYSEMNSVQREALEMILHKIGRIVNGNPNHMDSWHDLIGYATLVETICFNKK